MITMRNLGRLRRLYYRDGLSLSEIARKTGFARNTVKTWLRAAEGVEPKYRRRRGENTKISPYAAQLTKALETDARRPKRDRRTRAQAVCRAEGGWLSTAITAGSPNSSGAGARMAERRWSKPLSRCSSNWAKPSSSTGAKSIW